MHLLLVRVPVPSVWLVKKKKKVFSVRGVVDVKSTSRSEIDNVGKTKATNTRWGAVPNERYQV